MSLSEKISGQAPHFGLRHRIFNLSVFFAAFICLLNLLSRMIYSQHRFQIVLIIIIFVVLVITFYFSRVRRRYSQTVVLSSSIILVSLLGVSFFYNSGTDGKVIALLLLSMMVYFMTTTHILTYIVMAIHLVCVIVILTLQYYHPDWIVTYPTGKERLIDNFSSVFFIIIIMYFVLDVVRKEFEKERENIRTKNLYLEEKNQLIQDLLKELNHRVKNNLQVISSLLSLQAYRTKNPEAITALQEGKNRLLSMSLLHKKLYQDNFFNQISVSEYVKDLIDHSLAHPDVSFDIHTEIEDIMLTADQAVPLGLMLHEIFSGVIRPLYDSFDTDRRIEIRNDVNFNRISLSIVFYKLRSAGSMSGNKKTLSTELIDILIKQLDGTLSIVETDEPSTEINIRFNIKY